MKQRAPYSQFIPWDLQLNTLANELDSLRNEYFLLWNIQFHNVLKELANVHCQLEYFKGWDKKNSGTPLTQILADHFESDLQRQYTQYGAHQADISITSDEVKAKHFLSRGQQKIILIAMKLAQGTMLQGDCLYLFDDLPAELDDGHQKRLLNFLSGQKGQYIITSVSPLNTPESINISNSHCYEISNGKLERSIETCFT